MTGFRFSLEAPVGTLTLRAQLEAGRGTVAVIGPNGSGKSTLLRLLCGALAPTRGCFEVEGRVLYDSEQGVDVSPELRRIGYVPQGSGLFPHLDVLDNVAFSLRWGGAPRGRETARAVAREMLVSLGCEDLVNRPTRSLSGGERQRVALGRALVMDPAMLLFDEPLSALDPGARRKTRLFLAEQLATWGRPALVVTHDLRDLTSLGATALVMEAGRVVQSGSLEQLREQPESDFVREFIDVS